MENAKKLYENWKSYELEDNDLIEELCAIENNEDALFDAFYRELEFGTAGLRGIIGAGTNRMNIYTVRRATRGLADMLLEKKENPSVAISYDSRIKSDLFAKEAARTLASNGIKVYITDRLMPTPVLSFCTREYKCDAGIMITASHNPSKYNGYKAYGSDGCQMNEEDSKKVLEFASRVDYFSQKPRFTFEEALEKGIISYVEEKIYEDYYKRVLSLSLFPEVTEKAGLKLVYTPLNGTGNEPVRKILSLSGAKDITVVKEQEKPDGNFTTCPYPNPEIRQALVLGIELCEKENADLLIATDPDADRVGIAVKNAEGKAELMTGNAVGVLLLNYIATVRKERGSMPKNPVAVKSIVTTALAEKLCEYHGIEMKNVLTGFKYIGEQIRLLEEKGEEQRFLLGYEESYGYLSGSFVRDKDAVIATMLICEMASYYKLQNKSLLDVYAELEAQFGVYHTAVESFSFEGASGMKKMADIMEEMRKNPLDSVAGYKTLSFCDYKTGICEDFESKKKETLDLPSANVLQFNLENNCRFIIRPSGTEPKIKFYYTVVAPTREGAKEICKEFSALAGNIAK